MKLAVLEFKKRYLDHLEIWVEVPEWDQLDLLKYVNEIDWDDLSEEEYKKLLVEHWPGLPNTVKTKLDDPVVRNELYEVLLHENWALVPSDRRSYYSEVETRNVELWFKSHGKKGQSPAVLYQ